MLTFEIPSVKRVPEVLIRQVSFSRGWTVNKALPNAEVSIYAAEKLMEASPKPDPTILAPKFNVEQLIKDNANTVEHIAPARSIEGAGHAALGADDVFELGSDTVDVEHLDAMLSDDTHSVADNARENVRRALNGEMVDIPGARVEAAAEKSIARELNPNEAAEARAKLENIAANEIDIDEHGTMKTLELA